MEQTLGKRLVACRKAMGMTQDQLAERLGVTAQAVSKWENDLSCPDINTLPRLAEIFGTTTDALLGIVQKAPAAEEPEEPVKAEVISETRQPPFRKHSVLFAIGVLLVGGVYLAAALLKLKISLWDIVWPAALLVFGVAGFIPFRRFSFLRMGCILCGGFFLINGLLPSPLNLDTGVVVACIILLAGAGLLMNALCNPEKQRRIWTIGSLGSQDGDRLPRSEFAITDGKLLFEAAFGEGSHKVVTPLLRRGMINTSFGDYEISLCGVEEVVPECRLEVNVSFGDLILWVPSKYQVCCSNTTAFADVEICGKPDAVPAGTIQLIASVSFGNITVEYI